jgi:serine protease inhibitor
VDYFYSGSVDQIEFAQIEDKVRKRVNALVETKTKSQIADFVGHDHPNADRPMAFFAANFFRV